MDGARRFVVEHTELIAPAFVPELRLHLATEVTPLWHASQLWLDEREVPPPYWAFAWAGGQGLARYLLDHPELVRGRSVLDLCAGGGLVAIAAAICGAARVVAADTDALARAALQLNAAANDVQIEIEVRDLPSGPASCPGHDLLLAGDVFYEQAFSTRLHAWLGAVARSGVSVLVGDPERAYAPSGLALCASYDVPVSEELESAALKRTNVWSYDALAARPR